MAGDRVLVVDDESVEFAFREVENVYMGTTLVVAGDGDRSKSDSTTGSRDKVAVTWQGVEHPVLSAP